jgi:hypothetical protein
MENPAMSTGSALEAEIVQIADFVRAKSIIAKAICRAYLPCICQGNMPCHAETIYRREAEIILSELTKVGLIHLARPTDLDNATSP